MTTPTLHEQIEWLGRLEKAEIDKALADWPRVKPAPAEPLENWYYLDESHQLHQLGKDQTFEDAYGYDTQGGWKTVK